MKTNYFKERVNYSKLKSNTDLVIRMLDNSLIKWANGMYTFCDADKIIYVDTVKGLCGAINKGIHGEDVYAPYVTGSESRKANGYVYLPINYYNEKGNIDMFPFGQHTLILLITDRAGYKRVKNKGNRPECCHKRGCPWDNRSDNLEWGSRSENARQGKIATSLEHHFPGKYTSIGHNLSKSRFVILKQPILNDWINEYIEYKECNPFKLIRHDEYISAPIVLEFVHWLENKGYWK